MRAACPAEANARSHAGAVVSWPTLLLLLTLLGTVAAPIDMAAAAAAKTTPQPAETCVAVLPFRDLSVAAALTGSDTASGSASSSSDAATSASAIGEAIRETVTSDLKERGGLRVVERSSLDRVLREQGVQAAQRDPDLSSLIKLGKVVGATLIVIGAFQKLPPQLRLTARLVRVETSEILGTAKVDGSTREFLRLQDRITAALLRSAGLPVHAKRFEESAPKRPPISSLRTLETYGQAALAKTDEERQQRLKTVVAEDRDFTYAQRDLQDLERRLARYQADARPLQERMLDDLRAQAQKAQQQGDVAQAANAMVQLLARLAAQARWHAIVREARAFLQALPPQPEGNNLIDAIAMMLVQYDGSLKDYDAVLRDGEWYLKRTPGSAMFMSIDTAIKQAIESKRRVEEGKKQVAKELADAPAGQPKDKCRLGDLYRNAEQYTDAIAHYEACSKSGTKGRDDVLPLLLLSAFNGGLWKTLRALLAEQEARDPLTAQRFRNQYQGWMPTDE